MLQMKPFDHLAIHPYRTLGGIFRHGESVDYTVCPRNFRVIGKEGGVAQVDLSGVNQRLAIETKFDGLTRLRRETGVILQIIVDAVENGDAMRPRRSHRQAKGTNERQTIRAGLRAHFLGKIVRAHHQRGNPLGTGDLVQPKQRCRSFDHHPNRRCRCNARSIAFDVGATGNLWNEDRIGTTVRKAGQIVRAPFGIQPINADDQFSRAKATFHDRRDGLLTGDRLRVGRDGIFQIQDHDVAR